MVFAGLIRLAWETPRGAHYYFKGKERLVMISYPDATHEVEHRTLKI